MRFFRALCATLGALLIMSTVVFGAHAADAQTLSEAYVLTKDGQLVDTLTIVDPSRTMSESACTPYAGSSTDQHVEFVTRDDATICHMQLMYTRAQDESEFTLQNSGTFVLSARTDQTLAAYRKTFGASLTFASVSLSVEGEVQSATSGAATSATTYEGRALSVSTWTDTVPQVITVNGTLAAGGNPAAAAGANSLKDPWGATPVPGSKTASDNTTPASSDSDSSSGPSLGLLIGLIVGLIVIVLVVVIVIYVVRSKRSKESAQGVGQSTPPSHARRPSAPQGMQARGPTLRSDPQTCHHGLPPPRRWIRAEEQRFRPRRRDAPPQPIRLRSISPRSHSPSRVIPALSGSTSRVPNLRLPHPRLPFRERSLRSAGARATGTAPPFSLRSRHSRCSRWLRGRMHLLRTMLRVCPQGQDATAITGPPSLAPIAMCPQLRQILLPRPLLRPPGTSRLSRSRRLRPSRARPRSTTSTRQLSVHIASRASRTLCRCRPQTKMMLLQQC